MLVTSNKNNLVYTSAYRSPNDGCAFNICICYERSCCHAWNSV